MPTSMPPWRRQRVVSFPGFAGRKASYAARIALVER